MTRILFGFITLTFLLTGCSAERAGPTESLLRTVSANNPTLTPSAFISNTTSTPDNFISALDSPSAIAVPKRTQEISATLKPSATPAPASTTPRQTPTATFDVSRAITVTPAPPAVCPAPHPSQVPEADQPVLEFLNGGGTIRSLIEALSQEYQDNPFYDPLNEHFIVTDITGDGVPELVVTINGVHIYGCQKGEYALLTIIPPNEDTFPAKIVSLRDMDVDGLPDIVIVEEACMIGECIFARIYEWDGNLFQSLVSNEEEDSAFLWPGVVDIFDTDGNGTLELILKGGISGGDDYFSHGPWRLESHIFSWNGRVFVLDRVEFTPPEYRFQAVQDGDKALSQGQYGKALAYYQQAISDDMLKPWSPELREHIINVAYWDSRTPTPTPPLPDPDEIDQLVAYSQFKIIVLYTLRGMAPEAQTAYNTLLEMFPGENPGYLYTEMATGFWFEYQSSGDMVKACQKAIDYAATHSEILTPIGSDYHGWQSQIYKPEDVCLLLLGR